VRATVKVGGAVAAAVAAVVAAERKEGRENGNAEGAAAVVTAGRAVNAAGKHPKEMTLHRKPGRL